MSRPLTACLLIIVLGSCQLESDDESRHLFVEDGVTFVAPEGWELRHDRGTLVLVESAVEGRSRSTIALRSVPVNGWSETRTPENVLPSTEQVLRSLPEADVSGPTSVEHPLYIGMAYDVTFAPRSRHGEKYRRRHIILFAPGRVIHLLHTGPRDQLDRSTAAFEQVLQSIREEG